MRVAVPTFRKCCIADNAGSCDLFDNWEIGVPELIYFKGKPVVQEVEGLYYCTILALMIPLAQKDADALKEIFQKLVGPNSKINSIMNYIKSYNCFLNRKSCFYNRDLTKFIIDFKRDVERYIQDNPKKFQSLDTTFRDNVGFNDLGKLEKIIEACSLILKCRIVVILKMQRNGLKIKKDFVIFPLKQPNFKGKHTIILYRKKAESKAWMHFGLPQEVGNNLQKNAFWKILHGMGKSDNEIMELYNTPNASKNFIVALLKSDNTKAILELFSYPSHILTKLSDAGFTVDPYVHVMEMDKDYKNYPTAFYYAMMCAQNTLLTRLLYDHATKRFNVIEGSPRLPNDVFLINLMELKWVLKDARDMIPSSERDAVHMADNFILFHEFMTEMTCHIYIEHMRKIMYKEEEKVAELRGKTLWGIVELYLKYFHIRKEKIESNFGELYDKYVGNRIYYMHLDFHSAVVMFDHCFAAKESLELEDNFYNVIESALIRYAFTFRCYSGTAGDMRNLYKKVKNDDNFKNYKVFDVSERSDGDVNINETKEKAQHEIMARVTHMERMKLGKVLQQFLEKLQKAIPNCTKREKITIPEIYTLKEEPVIKDEFMLQYLIFYSDALKSVPISKNALKGGDDLSISCIERSLQVMGELVRSQPSEELTFLKAVLLSILPVDVAHDLKQIRNSLCTSESVSLHARYKGTGFDILQNVKEELCLIYKRIIQRISSIHKHRMREFILKNALDTLKDCEEFYNNSDMSEHQKSSSCQRQQNSEGETVINPVINSRTVVKDLFGTSEFSCQKATDVLLLQREENKRSLNLVMDTHFFKICLENTETAIEKGMNTPNENIDYTICRFSCLKLLITHLIKDGACDETKRQQFLLQLDENADNFEINKKEHENMKEQVRSKLQKCTEFINTVVQHMEMIKFDVRSVIQDFESCSYIRTFQLILTGKPYASNKFKKELLVEINGKANGYRKKLSLRPFSGVLLSKQYDSELYISEADLDTLSENANTVETECDANYIDILNEIFASHKDFKRELEKHELSLNTYNNVCKHFNLKLQQKEILKTLVREEKDNIQEIEQDKTQKMEDKTGKSNKDCKNTKAETVVQTHEKLKDISLEFFYNRVNKLKGILIDYYPDIKNLWENAKSLETKGFLKDKLIRQYLKTPKLRAAVEMLFFDCTNVVKGWDNKMATLWKKTNRALNGINFRNVLAHGNRLLEAIDTILDPEDLANEIISKILDPFDDIECLKAMCELKKETEADDWETFISCVNNEDEKYKSLRDKIKYSKDSFFRDRPSNKWMKYVKLIPMKRKQP